MADFAAINRFLEEIYEELDEAKGELTLLDYEDLLNSLSCAVEDRLADVEDQVAQEDEGDD